MIFPWQLCWRYTRYLMGKRLSGQRRFPWVLMLEPTLRCNLACAGCGRIREYHDVLDRMLTPEECLGAAREAGAPVVSITGGEPLIHPQIADIVQGLVRERYFVYLCTNGLLLEPSLPRFNPHPYLSFVVHLDGLSEVHDGITGRKGVFDIAVQGIRAAKARGFQVRTNTTVYKGTRPEELERLFALLMELRVDGVMVSPGFSYEAVGNNVFLSRPEAKALFGAVYRMRDRVRFYNTPPYLQFLAGQRELQCTPWANPTRNPKGWKSPCYLITDGHCQSFAELMEQTEWERYGVGHDPRCANCMVHCGFEASAITQAAVRLSDLWQMARWNFTW